MEGISARNALQGWTPDHGGVAMVHAISEFLTWLEFSKGLRLCEAFRTQYDWYIPVPTNAEKLATEFLSVSTNTAEFGKEHGV